MASNPMTTTAPKIINKMITTTPQIINKMITTPPLVLINITMNTTLQAVQTNKWEPPNLLKNTCFQ